MRHCRSAFSLVELSIVLVVIGLIVGGILVGQSLVSAAGTRGVMTDMRNISTAIQVFQDKYDALPGDLPNAQSYWGTLAGGCPSSTTAATGTATCNGNGDGWIDTGIISSNNEMYRAWQHLANAGLWPGLWPGIPSIASGQTVAGDNPGVNMPQGNYNQLGSSVSYRLAYDSNHFDTSVIGNFLYIGGSGVNPCCGAPFVDAGALTPVDAKSIDTKLDDGLPGFGSLQVKANYCGAGHCASTCTATTAIYAVSSPSYNCPLYYDIGIKQ